MADNDPHRTVVLAAMPLARPEPNVASGLRKAQVRAALFHKVEPLKIGRFVLLEPLGAGAMGEIYAAYDDQLDRKVALKLVRAGSSLTAKADDRLLREAQTLAQVSHPNVVQIYEAGTFNGRLFIAMELIRGKTLSRWLTEAGQVPRPVRMREILRQFIAAGRGLEAAHAAGVAHRDFKPDNVLVGDDGRVRVVDFGLARALGHDEAAAAPTLGGARGDGEAADELESSYPHSLEDSELTEGETVDAPPSASASATPREIRDAPSAPRLKAAMRLTETGTVMGTPSYMAPEQMRGGVADLRSDQFSFCVSLYHALYETFPFSGRSLRELRDSMESGSIAIVPGVPVSSHVRRALLRGLSVDPALRFPSMRDLLAALEPKVRRTRASLFGAAVCLAVASGVAGMALASRTDDPCATAGAAIEAPWSVVRQTVIHAAFRASDLAFAEAAWHGVKTRVDDFTARWRDAATSACRATELAHTQSAELLDKRMLCLDRGRRQLAALVGLLETVRPDMVSHAIDASDALPEPDACGRVENLVLGVAPPPPVIAPQVTALRDQLARASNLDVLGHASEAIAIARPAIATADRLGYVPLEAEAYEQAAFALILGSPGDRATAEAMYFTALDLAEASRHDELSQQIWDLIVLLAVRRDDGVAQARTWWRREAAAVHRLGDPALPLARLHHTLGEIDYRDGKYSDAVADEQRAIAALPRTPMLQLELGRYEDALAKALERLDRVDEAVQLHDHALATMREAYGASHPSVIKIEINFGKALEKHGELGRARSVLETALASMTVRDRETSTDAARLYGFLSDVDYTEGKLDLAAEHGRASLAVLERMEPPDRMLLAAADVNLGNVESERHNYERALVLFEDARALDARTLGADHYQTGVVEGSLAETLAALGRYTEALPHVAEATRIFARGSGHERATEAWIAMVRGTVLAGAHQREAAIPVLEQAIRLGESVGDPTNEALAMFSLACVLHDLDRDPGRVRALAERAHTLLSGEINAARRDTVARFLAQLHAP
jgi:serine/threonine protein kinase/tetratricopeptide (TPR) repeat protein